MAGSSPLDSFGVILSGLAKRLGLESRLMELRLQHHWRDMIGEPTASHTWPDGIRFKKLYLVVRNSVWLQQLSYLKPALLAKLHAEIGPEVVTEIVFRVGEIPAHATGSRGSDAASHGASSSEEQVAEASTHTSVIRDATLRRHFTEVISRYPSRAPLPPEEGPLRAP